MKKNDECGMRNDEIGMMSDERLNELGDRFVEKRIGRLMCITFEQYLTDPEWFDGLADDLEQGFTLIRTEPGRFVAWR